MKIKGVQGRFHASASTGDKTFWRVRCIMNWKEILEKIILSGNSLYSLAGQKLSHKLNFNGFLIGMIGSKNSIITFEREAPECLWRTIIH